MPLRRRHTMEIKNWWYNWINWVRQTRPHNILWNRYWKKARKSVQGRASIHIYGTSMKVRENFQDI